MNKLNEKKTVCLLKSPKEDDQYKKELESAGFEVRFVPILSFSYCNEVLLLQSLQNNQNFSGIVITSKRAVNALLLVVKGKEEILDSWKSKKWFSIGHETFHFLQEKLKPSRLYGEKTNSGEELSSVIRKEQSKDDKPLLFLCGNRRRDDIPNNLKQFNISFEELAVYSSNSSELSVDTFGNHFDWIVFFSPSGVETFKEQLGAWEGSQWERDGVRVAAIGPTTAEALGKFVGDTPPSASEPTPQSLCEVLKTCGQ